MPEESPKQDYFEPIKPKIEILGVEGAPYSDAPRAVVERLFRKPVVVNLFTDGPDAVFDPASLQEYLGQTFGPNFTVINHGDLITYALEKDPEKKQQIVGSLAKANSTRRDGWPSPDEEKIKLEEEAIGRDRAASLREFALHQSRQRRYRLQGNGYYYIPELGEAYSRMIPQDLRTQEEDKRKTFLIVTGRGIGEKMGRGIHMRAGFTHGNIAVVSTTGLVEAPGKPLDVERTYEHGFIYTADSERGRAFREELRQRGNKINGEILEEILNKVYADKMIYHSDARINEAIKGITLSMILFTLGEYGRTGNCSTTDLAKREPDMTKFCRLHDAHRQEELMATQFKDKGQPEFCNYHEEIFSKLKRRNFLKRH